tara:strand:- start:84 stop:275 length:192 start_codon:yes stop_codon:yes gene_type:complete
MGRLKEFLINEQMRITGNWREQDHAEYLAWRNELEQEERVYYEGKSKIQVNEYGNSRNGNADS